MLRRIAVLASLAVVGAMFVGGTTANAAVGDAGVCVFTGLAGGLTPGIQDISNDPGLIDVEQGNYTFATTGGTAQVATCAGVFGGAPQVQNVSITSNGKYDNILCGTGFAHDLSGANTHVTAPGIDITNAGYEIPFVAGVGPLVIGPGPSLAGLVTGVLPKDPVDADNHAHPAKTSDWLGAGLVQITPGTSVGLGQDNCVSNDGRTDAFQVKGFFVGAGIAG